MSIVKCNNFVTIVIISIEMRILILTFKEMNGIKFWEEVYETRE